jgi:hypothetical protein
MADLSVIQSSGQRQSGRSQTPEKNNAGSVKHQAVFNQAGLLFDGPPGVGLSFV